MAVAGVIFLLLGFAAWRDIATRTIPDAVSVGLVMLGLAARIPDGLQAVGLSAGAAVLLFLLLIPLHGRGLIGGGDLKLLASLAFGLPPLASYQMVCAVVMAGGVLAVFYLMLRHVLARRGIARRWVARHRSLALRVIAVEIWRIRKGAPLPYGLAIAAGASFVIGHSGA